MYVLLDAIKYDLVSIKLFENMSIDYLFELRIIAIDKFIDHILIIS